MPTFALVALLPSSCSSSSILQSSENQLVAQTDPVMVLYGWVHLGQSKRAVLAEIKWLVRNDHRRNDKYVFMNGSEVQVL